MRSDEDFFYDVYLKVREKGIAEDFYKQLDKMKFQDHHKYKTVRETWEYAYKKILSEKLNQKERKEAHKNI